jgi:hypothetical protein
MPGKLEIPQVAGTDGKRAQDRHIGFLDEAGGSAHIVV